MDTDTKHNKEWRSDFFSTLSSGLREQQKSGHFCDVTVIVADVSFTCHKVVLSAVSPYFAAMFAHDMKESRECVVRLPEMTSSMFQRLLDCMYDGEDIVTDDNAQEVLEIATLMQMDVLQNRVQEYFKNYLTLDNFIYIWYVAKKYSCKKVEEHIWKFMLNKFVELCQRGDLSLLPFETFEALLGDDGLNVPSEDVVWDAVVKWMNVDIETRMQDIPTLDKTIRLPLCSPEYILQRLNTEDPINQAPEVITAVREALTYKMYTARKHDFTTLQTTQRRHSNVENVMVVIGGTDDVEYSGSGMRCYSFQRKLWFELPSLPQNVGPYYALCTYDDDLYVSGGQYHREAFHRFQASTCSWSALSKLPVGRFQHAMTAIGDVIYFIGGETEADDKTIYGYHVHSELWETYGELLDNVKNANTAIVDRSLLIFGCNENNAHSDVIQYFDVTSIQITRVAGLKLPGSGCQALLYGNASLIISQDGTVSKLSNDLTTKELTTIEIFSSSKFVVTQFRGHLYFVAALESDSEARQYKVVVYDVNILKVVNSFSIPNTKHGDVPWLKNSNRLSCAKITIGKHNLKEVK